MSKAILAVSGGVDSMAMLDLAYLATKYSFGDINFEKYAVSLGKLAIFFRNYASGDIIVAHFDHGIRANSKEDMEFVRQKAAEYGLIFEYERGELGENTSEAAARASRYNFLNGLAEKYKDGDMPAEIWTAHHLDDLIETVAINFVRGTGWRGLAVLDTEGVRRPFLEMADNDDSWIPWGKAQIIKYAVERNLSWREDPTNNSGDYLRNRLRECLDVTPDEKVRIWRLWNLQKTLRREIDNTIQELLPVDTGVWERSWFRGLDAKVALELLRLGIQRAGISATRPQLENFRQAILNYAPGKSFNLPGDRLIKLGKESFRLLDKR